MYQIQELLKIKKTTNFVVFLSVNQSWWSYRDANGTLEEWVKKSEKELAVIEGDIREIRKLFNEDSQATS
jgi:hypothetical protein